MRLLAPAKINLHLRVGRRRDDGFHPLLTWMCTVGLFDTLTLRTTADAGTPAKPAPAANVRAGVGVDLEIAGGGDRPDLPRGGDNLVVRIATAFLDELAREPIAAPRPTPKGPTFLEEEGVIPPGTAPDRASGPSGGERAASVGAAPGKPPGTVGERARGSGGGTVHSPEAPTPSDAGAGAARGSEASGRSRRYVDEIAPDLARVVIGLDKRIPIGAGLGGGSSDAACALVGLDRMLSSGWSAEDLSAFAARFGSDVPFFVHVAHAGANSAACRGRGEVVRPVARPKARWAVLFHPPFALATRDVYARFDAMGLGDDAALEAAAEPDWAEWAGLAAPELMGRLGNDLEPAAFSLSAALAELREALARDVGRVVRMSGSGSSSFTLFDAGEESAARGAAEMAEKRGVTAVVAEVTPVCHA